MPKRRSPKEVWSSDFNITPPRIWKPGFESLIHIKNVLKILLNKVLSSFLAEVETERDSFRDEMLKLKTDLVTLGPVLKQIEFLYCHRLPHNIYFWKPLQEKKRREMERAIQSEISSIGPDERRVDVPRSNHLKQSSSSSSSSSSSGDFSYGMEWTTFCMHIELWWSKKFSVDFLKVKAKSRVENKIHQSRNRRGARYQSLTIERIKRGNTFKHASFFETKAIQ